MKSSWYYGMKEVTNMPGKQSLFHKDWLAYVPVWLSVTSWKAQQDTNCPTLGIRLLHCVLEYVTQVWMVPEKRRLFFDSVKESTQRILDNHPCLKYLINLWSRFHLPSDFKWNTGTHASITDALVQLTCWAPNFTFRSASQEAYCKV